ncbi:MAG: hypothetical protein IPP32_15190 [Bacteroidetes bacterium]|nr:hypothetical protein [Bacteroidota bacterium]
MITKKIWNKKGQIFSLKDYSEWGNTHGQVPYFIEIGDKKKIFFTSRPKKNEDGTYVSHIHSMDVEYNSKGFEILKIQKQPLLKLGEIGHFDEFGTMPCSVVNHPEKNEVWMYYVGWSRKFSTPYECAIGLAISRDGGETFSKSTVGPIVSANQFDPFVLGCPRVVILNNNWFMFYLTGIKWLDFNGRKECFYKLKMATSIDGIEWQRDDKFIVPERYQDECQTCASVYFADGMYQMYFTYRHSIDFRNPERGYRIGYAYSKDLITWERNDEAGNFTVSESGWDSEMVCYPNVNLINGKQIMLYCGNSFGLDGFGFAELE